MQDSAKSRGMAGIRENLLLIVLAAVFWIVTLTNPWALFGSAGETVQFIQYMVWLAFVLLHGSRRYGWDSLFIFLGITFILSWTIESVSIAASFPFGSYHYTDVLGVKIGAVPVAIMAAYCVAGYLAWTMGTIFLGNLGTGMEKKNLILVPFIGSYVMVMWDFCFDPIRSTIERAWIWEHGGAFFGVPISNYLGWFVTVFLIFQLFALYLYRFGKNDRLEASKTYWVLAPVMFLGLAAGYLLNPFFQTQNLTIYWTLFLAAVFTMVFASVLNIIFVARMGRDS